MKRETSKRNYIRVKGIPAYLEWIKEMASYCFIVTASGNFYLINGIRVPAETFEASLPCVSLQANRVSKGDHKDGRVIQ